MRNIYPNLTIKMLPEIKRISIFFPDFSCMHRHMCVHARYIPGSRNSWYVSEPSFIRVTMCGWQRTAEANFFVYFWRKRGFASIIIKIIVWQLLHTAVEGQPCVLIFRPSSHFVHFQNWPPRMKPLRKLYPHQKIDKWPTIARQGERACLQLTEWLINWPTVCDGKCAIVLTNTRSNMILRSKISKSHLGTHAFRLKLLQRHKNTAYFWS